MKRSFRFARRQRRIALLSAAFLSGAPSCRLSIPALRAQPATNAQPLAKTPAQIASEAQATEFFAALTAADVARATVLLNANPKLATTSDKNNYPPLYSVVQSGSVELAKLLLDKGADVNNAGRSGGYGLPLIQAVQNNKKELVALFLERGADPNKSDRWGNYSPLFSAIERNNKEITALLIDKGADLNKNNSQGYSPLTQALQNVYGDSAREFVSFLIDKGAKVNARDGRGMTALQAAIMSYNSSSENIEMLLKKGADVNATNSEGLTVLHLLASPTVYGDRNKLSDQLKLLLSKGADVNAKSKLGDTPLHLAAASQAELIAPLVKAGAKLNARNKRGDLPLHVALRSEVKGWEDALIPNSNIDARDRYGMTALQLALVFHRTAARDAILLRKPKADATTTLFDLAAQNDVPALRKLLDAKPLLLSSRLPDGSTPLHVASLWLARDTVDLLLKKGADIEARDAQARTPLARAVHAEKSVEARRDMKIVATRLIKKGATAATLDSSDNSPLHAAAANGDLEMVSLLLNSDAPVDVANQDGLSPLQMIPLTIGDKEDAQMRARDIAALLLEKGADVNAGSVEVQRVIRTGPGSTTSYGLGAETLLARAVSSNNLSLATLLLDKGASVNRTGANSDSLLGRAVGNKNVEMTRLLLARGADTNAASNWGDSLLNRAIGYSGEGDREIVALLLEKGAGLKELDDSGETPLTRAVSYGANKEMIAFLIEKGADINAANNNGDTSLHRAVNNSNKEMVALLIEKKADVNIKNQKGDTPLAIALRAKSTVIADMLRAAGAKE
jgi:ankyrin repeat protein